MTNEQARNILSELKKLMAEEKEPLSEEQEALSMAIIALKQEKELPCIYDLKNKYCPRLDDSGFLKNREQEPSKESKSEENLRRIAENCARILGKYM